ncbi:hypothetical protein PILCRDRAFT_636860 [Piloderma croceum F 1598]|uniref:Uncharacterized protein n=1 Tax=Piloderma croceum (strain F 1598) TaxID=765440 RepID=A0A0C3AS84_PILCF|nr:hypothetical protein PILCRDRAFT_636860 [Piloderma croceum F 1598]
MSCRSFDFPGPHVARPPIFPTRRSCRLDRLLTSPFLPLFGMLSVKTFSSSLIHWGRRPAQSINVYKLVCN